MISLLCNNVTQHATIILLVRLAFQNTTFSDKCSGFPGLGNKRQTDVGLQFQRAIEHTRHLLLVPTVEKADSSPKKDTQKPQKPDAVNSEW